MTGAQGQTGRCSRSKRNVFKLGRTKDGQPFPIRIIHTVDCNNCTIVLYLRESVGKTQRNTNI